VPAVGWVHRLLHLLNNVAMRGLLALAIAMADWIVLVALAIVIPPISESSSKATTNLHRVTMALWSQECVSS
jgi:hypothetical protein